MVSPQLVLLSKTSEIIFKMGFCNLKSEIPKSRCLHKNQPGKEYFYYMGPLTKKNSGYIHVCIYSNVEFLSSVDRI